MKRLRKIFPKGAKCEDCGKESPGWPAGWPAGWVKSGASKHGRKYEKSGIAWHCPDCRRKLDL
jgi:hypothetical protein